jgi:hypothetical protein
MGRFFQQPDKNNAEYFAVVQELKQSTGRSILISIMAVSLVCFFTVVITLPFSWNFWMVMGLALSTCAISYLLMQRSIWLSTILLIAGLLTAIGLGVVNFRVPEIILPLLNPVTLSAVIILGHISLKIFDLISALTGPGAGFSTDVPAYYLFDPVFRGNHFARGASIASLILIMVSILVAPYLVYNARTGVKQ